MQTTRGFSLTELMIGMAIGMIILLGLGTVFINSLLGQKEFSRSAEQIENGRYAIDVISNDLRLAGFYGHWEPVVIPTAISDACVIPTAASLATYFSANAGHAVVAYPAADLSTTADLSGAATCQTQINSKLAPGSDVLVVRHADSEIVAVGGDVATNEIYLQANGKTAELQLGAGSTLVANMKADGSAATIKGKNGVAAAEVRKFRTHVYFVDRTERTPTLKRLELKSVGGTLKMDEVSLAEGIEALTVDFSVDENNADGIVESTTRNMNAARFGNTLIARVRVLARNTEASNGFTDNKVYDMGLIGDYGPRNDSFRRHLFTAVVRLVNPASRRDGRGA